MRRIAVIAVLALGARAVAAREIGSTRKNVIGGDTWIATDGVAALTLDGQSVCSAALVAPSVLITAAHCVVDDASDVRAFFGWTVGGPGVAIDVAWMRPHPAYDAATGENDVAVVGLTETAPVPPYSLPTRLDLAELGPGTPVTVVGFGIDASGRPGNKNLGESRIESTSSQAYFLQHLPAITCDGDSGGPTLFHGSVVAIHSQSDCATRSIEQRIDVAREFIEQQVALAETDEVCAGAPCSESAVIGGCQSAPGGPGSSAWVLAALWLLGLRRRQPAKRSTRPAGLSA